MSERAMATSTPQVESPTEDCPKCAELQNGIALSAICCIKLDKNLEDLCVGANQREEFLKAVNALLNTEGGGAVIIHTEKPHCMDDFHKKVDDALLKLIPDDSIFQQTFRLNMDDEKHVIYTVEPRAPGKYLSTLHFHTKMSLDKGLNDPTHGQIRTLMRTISEEQRTVPVRANMTDIQLRKGQEVEVAKANGIFRESRSVQAKDLKNKPPKARIDSQGQQDGVGAGESDSEVFYEPAFANKFWDKLSVRDFISAFAKQDEGGSMYLGVREMKEKQRSVPQVWYQCRGVRGLKETERKELCANIKEKVCTTMLWLGKNKPENPVDIIFHRPIDGEPDLRVVQIQVKHYHGLCFYYKEGPEAYWIPTLATIPERVPLEDWVVKNGGDEALMRHTPQFLASHSEMDIDHTTVTPGGANVSEKLPSSWIENMETDAAPSSPNRDNSMDARNS